MNNKVLTALLSAAESQRNEEKLQDDLSVFFRRLEKDVLENLEKYWSDYLLVGQLDIILAPIQDSLEDYQKILENYNNKEYKLGIGEAERLVNHMNEQMASKAVKIPTLNITREEDLFATLAGAREDLLQRVFTASIATLARVDDTIKKVILEGYESGLGIAYVRDMIQERFTQLRTWEAQRIARTEIHNAHNKAVMDTYNEIGVQYTQWSTGADDGRVRPSHLELDGEIIRVGETYSNGLAYPGDTSGAIEEWINCRCANAPYVILPGYMAPPFSPFREEDLIEITTEPYKEGV